MSDNAPQLKEAFLRVLAAEDAVSSFKSELTEQTTRLKVAISESEMQLAEAWKSVAALMSETGEFEVLIPGAVTDFRIKWATPRESVKADAEACPDEFVKLERKPRLKEIGDHLKGLRDSGQPMPNFASFETGEPKLMWTAVKKGAS